MLTFPVLPNLARSLRRRDVVAVVLNGVIGAGIFGLPAKVFSLSGDYSLAAFGVCAACVMAIVLSFAEVAGRYSGTGGPYLYARDAYGPATGFAVGWLVWIARITSFSANCTLLPEYLDFFFPGAAAGLCRAMIILFAVGLLAFLNLRSVRVMADAGNAFAFGKLLPLAIFVGAGLFFLHRGSFSFHHAPGYHAFSQSVLLLVYAFTGFEMAVIPAGEIRSPERTLPLALFTGMSIVVVFYVLIQVVCIGTLPRLAESHRPLADSASGFLGTGGAVMITAGILISLAGNLNVLILAASRILFAMAESGELPRSLGYVHPKTQVPVVAVLGTITVMLGLTLSGTFIYLVTLSTISRLITYLVTCSVVRRWVGAMGVVSCLWLLSSAGWRDARDAGIGVGIGLIIYALRRSSRLYQWRADRAR
jgi:amino acid transporter